MPRLVKIRSWHIIKTATRGGSWLTLCGRIVDDEAETGEDFGDEKSCESCLRIAADA